MPAEPIQVSCHSQTVGFGASDVGPGLGGDITPASPLSKASSCGHGETWYLPIVFVE